MQFTYLVLKSFQIMIMTKQLRIVPKILAILFTLIGAMCFSCSKKTDPAPVNNNNNNNNSTDPVVVIPSTNGVMGFFLDDWKSKSFSAPSYVETAIPTAAANATVVVDVSKVISKIPPAIFAHNANTWMTSMVSEPVFMKHITALQPNVIRFPAGSGSDVYFWNAKPGQQPADAPLKLVASDGTLKDAGFMYGQTTDDWRASLDNYYDMLKQTNNIGILTMNYGYARYGTSANPVATAAHLAADWVRYDKGRTKYWEIGNEVYADWESGYRIDLTNNKDGQPEYITGKLYAQHFKVFADSMRKAATETGAKIYVGAVMYESEPQGYQANSFKTWNSTMLPELNNYADYYIGHNYFTNYNENSNAAAILTAALTKPAAMMDFMTKAMKTYGATIKPIAMTEWNMFAVGSMQQVSNISGVFGVIVQNETVINKFGLSARWDLLNSWDNGNDHGLFSDGHEPGVSMWSPRPSFYYLYFFKKFVGDTFVGTAVTTGNTSVKAYASSYSSGQANVTLLNVSNAAQTVEVKINNFTAGSRFYWYSLEGGSDNGEFSRKVSVNGQGTTGVAGGPNSYETIKARSAKTDGGIKITIPKYGMVCLVVDKQ